MLEPSRTPRPISTRFTADQLYNMDFHVVVVAVSGIGLRKTDMFGTPDPFVKVTIGNESFSSKPMKKTLSPVWNQPFNFKKVTIAQVSVWNWRKFSKKTGSGFM
eukprot:gene28363-33267_t